MKACYLVFFTLLVFSCNTSQETSKEKSTPRKKKETKLVSPSSNQSFKRGESVPFSFISDAKEIDSVRVVLDDTVITYLSSKFDIPLRRKKVGSYRIRAKAYVNGNAETHYRTICLLPENAPEKMSYRIVGTSPHDPNDYTQGLLIKDGFLYESTGRRGSSSFKKKNLKTGDLLEQVNLGTDLFGEGLASLNDSFYQLTWTSGKALVYNKNMQQIKTFTYDMEGWGLTTYGENLVMSDGTEKLYVIDPSSFSILSEIEVYNNQGKVESLNELELVDGNIYANVYQTNIVLVINPETGEVIQEIDFTDLLSQAEADEADVLNGIALNPETDALYVTGKLWPKLFNVKITPKTPIQ